MLTALRARRDSDDGTTLIELVVGMALAGLVTTFMLVWFLGASNANSVTTNSSAATGGARGVLQAWSKYLQLAVSPSTPGNGAGRISALTATSISFYANLNNTSTCGTSGSCSPLAPTLVTLSLSGKNLLRQLNSGVRSVDLPGNDVGAGSCLFTAYAGTTSLGCATLSSAQYAAVTSVTLAFTVTPNSGHSSSSFSTSATFTTSG